MSPSHALRRFACATLLSALVASPAASAELSVDIHDIGTQAGRLTVFVYASEAAWNGTGEPVRKQHVMPDGSDRLKVRFDGLAAGRYGVMVIHDRDGNRKFDVGLLGIPKDGYGFSNDPLVFKRPGFGRIAFDLPASGQRVAVRMK
ncbi:DUF2141 domain-containing protein [Lysobacter sp. A3-1-A15]|uniref:DUF2141 domain-containing protein n=1 Tax=Novilysobacter viscosus TaxID=3098602 RepID=UPI002ED7F0F0